MAEPVKAKVDAGLRGTAMKAVDPKDAAPEAREAVVKDALQRNAPEAHQRNPGPTHKFKLTYQSFSEVIEVENRHPGQAEIDARALFNDRIKKRPDPRHVSVERLSA
jgi:hypothetical protein